ncbi:ribosome small subunit-dependent GTPase A [Sporolactobacillus vineae]|uniref:ribosome small subunit-dependent GTPase A n=1 Tax=Sporolactobacillus vineae TaxID=444463 RepID=UPI000289F992|nr:ribosome small subunit-dependent GTPase A [Sporolactobacillus vineae]
MAEGTIIKALSGYYYVKTGDRQIQCRARGIFRKRGVTPLVGDHVVYEAENPSDGYIMSIRPRKNFLSRPPIANIDQALLVFSVSEPEFDSQLLDRFLIIMEASRIHSVICLTKEDLLSEDQESLLKKQLSVYRHAGYPVIVTSSKAHTGIDELRQILDGKVTVVTGQSGVGKSSLLNQINTTLNIETQSISHALGRGKHTTRHVALLQIGRSGFVADTPGFSSLDVTQIDASELAGCFPEFSPFSPSCRFRTCTHIAEPDCAVKHAVETGDIDPKRYDHYCFFYHEIKNKRKLY